VRLSVMWKVKSCWKNSKGKEGLQFNQSMLYKYQSI